LDLLYSLALLASLIAGAMSLLVGLLALVGTWLPSSVDATDSPAKRLGRVVSVGVPVSLCFALLSAGVHLGFGHRPGSAEALGPVGFITIHPAYLAAVAIAAVAALCLRLARVRLARRAKDSCS
jgi:hypothetical protein